MTEIEKILKELNEERIKTNNIIHKLLNQYTNMAEQLKKTEEKNKLLKNKYTKLEKEYLTLTDFVNKLNDNNSNNDSDNDSINNSINNFNNDLKNHSVNKSENDLENNSKDKLIEKIILEEFEKIFNKTLEQDNISDDNRNWRPGDVPWEAPGMSIRDFI